jgi:hypothetical protein
VKSRSGFVLFECHVFLLQKGGDKSLYSYQVNWSIGMMNLYC